MKEWILSEFFVSYRGSEPVISDAIIERVSRKCLRIAFALTHDENIDKRVFFLSRQNNSLSYQQ